MAQADSVTIRIHSSFPGLDKSSTGPACVGHTEFITNPAARPRPYPMPPCLHSGYFGDRAALWVGAMAVLDDIEATLGNLTPDVTGAIHQTTDRMAGRVA